MSHKSSMHGDGESYSGVVPAKQPNKSGQPPAEVVEGRPLTKENTPEPNSHRTPCRGSGRSGLERVREAAKKDGKLKFTALLHHVSIDLLRESYYSLKKKAAPGVDGVTWEEYGRDLEVQLSDLHGRIHRRAYRARPSRRTWISKSDGRKRPLGIAALEDKVVQSAVGTVLSQIWGEDFLGFQLRIPARTRTTRCTGRVVGRNRAEESELDFGSRHSILFRQTPARLAGPVCGTSDRRQASRPPDAEMAEGGRGGRRTVVPDRGRESARVGDDSQNAKDN